MQFFKKRVFYVSWVVKQLMDRGYIINCTHETVLRFLPPYIITEKEVDSAVKTLSRLFAKTGCGSRIELAVAVSEGRVGPVT